MDFRVKLSQRIGMYDVNEILCLTHNNNVRKQELYDLLMGDDDSIAYYAAWVFSHFSSHDNEWLFSKQDELIDEVLTCKHGGKRRVMLNLLYRQPFANPPRIDFLDFCLDRIMSRKELPGIQSLCIKIAYELCRPIPELMQELKTMLEMMEGNLLPSIQASRRNILKAMQKGKSLQTW